MNNIKARYMVGQVVTLFPYTAEIFNKYKIDYTFKGDQTLNEAINETGLNKEDIIGEIDLAIDEFKIMNPDVIYWENEPIDKILDHIEGHHHRFMTTIMSEISAKLEDVPIGEEVNDLKTLFTKLQDEMLSHQAKEEEELFPLLREYSNNRTTDLRHKIVKYMTKTQDEHDDAGVLFKDLNKLTDDFNLPPHSSEFMIDLYKKLDALEKDAFLHIHMENSILFKMI